MLFNRKAFNSYANQTIQRFILFFSDVFAIVNPKKEGLTVKDWLKQIPDDTRVCDINLPGTHDSAARFVLFSGFVRCQNKSITDQLDMGIRFLDLRVEADGERLKLVHSVIDCRKGRFSRKRLYMDDVLAEVFAFLEQHPTEAVFLLFKHDDGALPPAPTFDLFYERHVARETRFFTENRIPRLGEVRGKAVLLNRCDLTEYAEKYNDANSGINLANWPEQGGYYPDWQVETPIRRRSGEGTMGTLYLQDFYRLPPREKWQNAVLPTLNGAARHNGLVLNYCSATNGLLGPRAFEKKMSRKIAAFEPAGGRKLGWIILDFPKQETVERIIRSNGV